MGSSSPQQIENLRLHRYYRAFGGPIAHRSQLFDSARARRCAAAGLEGKRWGTVMPADTRSSSPSIRSFHRETAVLPGRTCSPRCAFHTRNPMSRRGSENDLHVRCVSRTAAHRVPRQPPPPVAWYPSAYPFIKGIRPRKYAMSQAAHNAIPTQNAHPQRIRYKSKLGLCAAVPSTIFGICINTISTLYLGKSPAIRTPTLT